jgi:hypothetical protein
MFEYNYAIRREAILYPQQVDEPAERKKHHRFG